MALEPAAWWTVRRAQSMRPATYCCPICDRRLVAMSEHVVLMPEGDASRRRHAHTECAMHERRAGRLPLPEDAPAGRASWWRRLLG